MKNWLFRERKDSKPEPLDLARSLGVSAPMASLLWMRSIGEEDELNQYLSPLLRHLSTPGLWPGMDEGAELLAQGLLEGKKVAVWGDYDVDGVTSTALVLQVIRHYGFDAVWHLPDRQSEGYGLNISHIEALVEQGVSLLLTVDCGISDKEPVSRARELGMTVIISDHHLPPEELPNANVLCNPQLATCPCATLAGVGVAFFLMAEVNNRLAAKTGKNKLDMRETLDLVALGTLADMVPLEGQNRILAKNGLLKITEAKRPGISELKAISGYQPLAALGAGQVVFSLAPRINAAGRMEKANTALELLMTDSFDMALSLAKELDALNTRRRQEEEDCVEKAHIQAQGALYDPALILVGEDWNQGIIGIVASRMVETYHKPCLVLCADGATLKGSGRSIRQFHLHDALTACADTLLSYGGHAMAAGVRVAPKQLGDFKKRFLEVTRSILGDQPVPPTQMLDGELDFATASDFTFLKELDLMQPFGIGNPEPVFASPPLAVRKYKVFGPKRNHVNLELMDTSTGRVLHAKAWKQAETLSPELQGKRIQIAYSPSLDTYNGITNVDIKIKDIKMLS